MTTSTSSSHLHCHSNSIEMLTRPSLILTCVTFCFFVQPTACISVSHVFVLLTMAHLLYSPSSLAHLEVYFKISKYSIYSFTDLSSSDNTVEVLPTQRFTIPLLIFEPSWFFSIVMESGLLESLCGAFLFQTSVLIDLFVFIFLFSFLIP